jgi:hypothetical protein
VSTASSSQILTLDISMDDAVFVEESKRHQNLSHRQRDLQLGKPLSSRLAVMVLVFREILMLQPDLANCEPTSVLTEPPSAYSITIQTLGPSNHDP